MMLLGRWVAAGVAVFLLCLATIFWLRGSTSDAETQMPDESLVIETHGQVAALPQAPEASDVVREAKRFRRYDRDRNASVDREEYLYSRRKSFEKLDTDGDGAISFKEYAIKQNTRFDHADADGNGTLFADEFEATRTARSKPKPKSKCDPA